MWWLIGHNTLKQPRGFFTKGRNTPLWPLDCLWPILFWPLMSWRPIYLGYQDSIWMSEPRETGNQAWSLTVCIPSRMAENLLGFMETPWKFSRHRNGIQHNIVPCKKGTFPLIQIPHLEAVLFFRFLLYLHKAIKFNYLVFYVDVAKPINLKSICLLWIY